MLTPGTRPLRVLVAGAGLFGREHLDRLVIREDVEVAGIADPNPAALDLARTRYQVADLCTDPLEMIARIPADAVIVATPSATHVEIALGAIDHKMAVLLEKPVAPSAELALRLADAAEAADVLVLPGHVLRHDRNHRRLAEIIRSGGIGAPLYVNARRYRDDSHAARYSDVDPVLMTLIHDIDLALWVAGASFRAAQAWRKPVADFRSMTATSCVTTTGVICDLRTAWTFAAGDLADAPENRRTEAERYLAVSSPKKMFEDMARKMTANMPEDQRGPFVDLFVSKVDMEALTNAMIESMVKHFSAEELKALADFYGSPVGKSAMSKFGDYMADLMPTMQKEMANAAQRMREAAPQK